MRVLIVSDTYPPDVNGAANFTERLGSGLSGRGHEVHAVAAAGSFHDSVEERAGVTVHRLRSVPWPSVDYFRYVLPWDAWVRERTLIDRLRPDVIHVQNHFVLGRMALGLAARRGIPVVATNHFMPENLMEHAGIPWAVAKVASAVAYWDLGRVFGKARALTAPTRRAVELFEARTHLGGVQAVSCGIDTEPYRAAAAAAPANDVPVILFVGRLDQEKRVDELLRAAAELPADLPYRVKVVGDGNYRPRWEQLSQSLGITDKVTFTGFLSDAELLEAYASCDIFCMPGVAELQSLVTLEAMSAGKPVVAANAMALPHLARPGINGWLFEPGDVADLASRLEHLLRDPEERRRMGAESARLIQSHSLADTLDRFEEIYARVTSVSP